MVISIADSDAITVFVSISLPIRKLCHVLEPQLSCFFSSVQEVKPALIVDGILLFLDGFERDFFTIWACKNRICLNLLFQEREVVIKVAQGKTVALIFDRVEVLECFNFLRLALGDVMIANSVVDSSVHGHRNLADRFQRVQSCFCVARVRPIVQILLKSPRLVYLEPVITKFQANSIVISLIHGPFAQIFGKLIADFLLVGLPCLCSCCVDSYLG